MISFHHGVAAGDPTSDGAVLWTRVTTTSPNAIGLAWTAIDDDTGRIVTRGAATALPDNDFTVNVIVSGLVPGRRYRYRFVANNGTTSPTGYFRTLPVQSDHIRFAVVSCAKYNAGYFNAYRRISERKDLDFVVHLGDYIYEAANIPVGSQTPGAGIGRDNFPLHECRTLADYRARYGQYRMDPDLQAFHAQHAIMATVDDHEIADNAWEGGADEHSDAEHGPWAVRMRDALQAWAEWVPSRAEPGEASAPIYRYIAVDDLLTLALLETRTHRSDPSIPDPELRTELGAEQLGWFAKLASNAKTNWLLVAVPSTVVPLWAHDLDEKALDALGTLKLIEPESGLPFHDLWDSYPFERRQMEAVIHGHNGRAIILSGDTHVSLEAEVLRDSEFIATEWTTPSLTSQNLDDKKGWGFRTQSVECEEHLLRSLPHLHWCDLDSHGYVVVNVTRAEASAEWWFVETVLEKSDHETCAHRATVNLTTARSQALRPDHASP